MLSDTGSQPLFSHAGVTPARVGLAAVGCVVALALLASYAFAGQLPVRLGAADSFAVLAGSTVTSTGSTTLNGDLGVSPGSALTGFPPGRVTGTKHATDPVAAQAQADLTTAYNDAAGRTPPNALPADVGGRTLGPGVYKTGATPALGLTGTLTLDGKGDPNAVFVFQVGSKLTTAVSSRVNLIGGAQPGNVFWQIGSSATLGTSSAFAGTILAYTSISMNDRVALTGRALARNGAVTLIDDTITVSRPRSDAFKLPGRPIHYAALGDSYSSGEGLGEGKTRGTPEGYLDGGDSHCDRHKAAYPNLFEKSAFESHPVMLDLFVACSGATTENIDMTAQYKLELRPQARNLKIVQGTDLVPNGTDLVSITIGGDDVGFADVLQKCYRHEHCDRGADARQVKSSFEKLPGKLRRVYRAIKHAAPHATIVVLGYPHVFPTNKKQHNCASYSHGIPAPPIAAHASRDLARVGFEPQEQDYLNNAADHLNQTIKTAARRTGVYFFNVNGHFKFSFTGHAHCEKKKQWINGLTGTVPPGPGSFHPNKAGQRAYENLLYGNLKRLGDDILRDHGRLTRAGLPPNPRPTR